MSTVTPSAGFIDPVALDEHLLHERPGIHIGQCGTVGQVRGVSGSCAGDGARDASRLHPPLADSGVALYCQGDAQEVGRSCEGRTILTGFHGRGF